MLIFATKIAKKRKKRWDIVCFVPFICNFVAKQNHEMRQLLMILAVALLLLGACGEEKSPLDAEARDNGMRAAAALVAVDHTDTMSMERAVMDAKSKQSVYALKRDSAAVRAFDEAFRAYLKEKDPNLYNDLFPDEKR